MAWSAENATNAYLHTLKSGSKGMEPDVAEFVSALAAGSGAHLILEARSTPAGPTTLALIAAAQQTGGRAICILNNPSHLGPSVDFLGENSQLVELIVGDANALLLSNYRGADFVLVDCELENQEMVFEAAQAGAGEACGGGVVVGYNAMNCERVRRSRGGGGSLLPIGGGLRVWRVEEEGRKMKGGGRRSQWVVRVDECTGEEHVFRIRPSSPRMKLIRA